MSENKRHSQTNEINDKSRGSVSIYLRCCKIAVVIFLQIYCRVCQQKLFFKSISFDRIACKKEGRLHVDDRE